MRYARIHTRRTTTRRNIPARPDAPPPGITSRSFAEKLDHIRPEIAPQIGRVQQQDAAVYLHAQSAHDVDSAGARNRASPSDFFTHGLHPLQLAQIEFRPSCHQPSGHNGAGGYRHFSVPALPLSSPTPATSERSYITSPRPDLEFAIRINRAPRGISAYPCLSPLPRAKEDQKPRAGQGIARLIHTQRMIYQIMIVLSMATKTSPRWELLDALRCLSV